MINLRKSAERGSADHGWLQAKHSFSFAGYYDQKYLGFRGLRVINEDHIAAGKGFATHGHQNMEIITYVISGELQHKDSMGNGSIIKPGEVQYMNAGRGVQHSERNPSPSEPLHLLQMWVMPETLNNEPSYDQKSFSRADKLNQLCLVATTEKAKLFACILESDEGKKIEYKPNKNQAQWIQIIRGDLFVNDINLSSGDGASVENENLLRFQACHECEFLLFELD